MINSRTFVCGGRRKQQHTRILVQQTWVSSNLADTPQTARAHHRIRWTKSVCSRLLLRPHHACSARALGYNLYIYHAHIYINTIRVRTRVPATYVRFYKEKETSVSVRAGQPSSIVPLLLSLLLCARSSAANQHICAVIVAPSNGEDAFRRKQLRIYYLRVDEYVRATCGYFHMH